MRSRVIRPAASSCALVRIAGDVDLSDAAALAALSRAVDGVDRLRVDLAGLRRTSLALVSWLVDVRKVLGKTGGDVTVERAPRSFQRLVDAVGPADLLS